MIEKIQTQTRGYVSRFEPLLYVSAFTQKDFHYIHARPSTKGPLPRNYNSTLRVHNSSLNTIISIQEGAQSKERNTLGDHKDHKHSLCDLKGSQTIFSHNKDPKDRIRIDWLNRKIMFIFVHQEDLLLGNCFLIC